MVPRRSRSDDVRRASPQSGASRLLSHARERAQTGQLRSLLPRPNRSQPFQNHGHLRRLLHRRTPILLARRSRRLLHERFVPSRKRTARVARSTRRGSFGKAWGWVPPLFVQNALFFSFFSFFSRLPLRDA